MKVLVTGAGGFIGSHICEELVARNYQVIGLVRKKYERVEHLLGSDAFKLIKQDLLKYSEVFSILKNERVNGVFHLAELRRTEKTRDLDFSYFTPNITATINLLEISRLLKIQKFIFTSAMSVYGLTGNLREPEYLPIDENHPTAPSDFHGLTKLGGELLCKYYAENYHLVTIILRYSGVYGPKRNSGAVFNFVEDALLKRPSKIFGNPSWDILYVKDIARATVDAYEKLTAFEIVNIGCGEPVDLRKLHSIISKLCNSDVPPKVFEGRRSKFFYDISKAGKLLNFKPQPLQESLSEYIRVLKHQLGI